MASTFTITSCIICSLPEWDWYLRWLLILHLTFGQGTKSWNLCSKLRFTDRHVPSNTPFRCLDISPSLKLKKLWTSKPLNTILDICLDITFTKTLKTLDFKTFERSFRFLFVKTYHLHWSDCSPQPLPLNVPMLVAPCFEITRSFWENAPIYLFEAHI